MEPTSHYRPSVSRETRRLLVAGLLAVAALWVLARVRFEGRPLSPNPVPAVLSQLAAPPSFDDLAGTIAQLQSRLEPWLLAFDVPSSDPGRPERRAAIRFRDELAVVVLPGRWLDDARVVARDRASGLAVVRVPPSGEPELPAAWTPRRGQQPRYLFATDVSPTGVSLRPVFVGALDPLASPWWPEPVWVSPPGTVVTAGTLLFSGGAEFAGVVVTHGTGVVVVPAQSALDAAARLLEQPPDAPGSLGIEVQPLTAALAAATGAAQGVVVTWVKPATHAEEPLRIGDVIEAVDGQLVATREHWDARAARLRAGETLALHVRRGGETIALTVTAQATAAAAPARPGLGLTLRRVPDAGAEVTRVDRTSRPSGPGSSRATSSPASRPWLRPRPRTSCASSRRWRRGSACCWPSRAPAHTTCWSWSDEQPAHRRAGRPRRRPCCRRRAARSLDPRISAASRPPHPGCAGRAAAAGRRRHWSRGRQPAVGGGALVARPGGTGGDCRARRDRWPGRGRSPQRSSPRVHCGEPSKPASPRSSCRSASRRCSCGRCR